MAADARGQSGFGDVRGLYLAGQFFRLGSHATLSDGFRFPDFQPATTSRKSEERITVISVLMDFQMIAGNVSARKA